MSPHDIENAARDALDKGKTEFGRFSNDMGTQAESAASQFQSAANEVSERVQDAANRMPDTLSGVINKGQDVYAKSSEEVNRRISHQPIESLLIAVAAGYFAGWLIHHRS